MKRNLFCIIAMFIVIPTMAQTPVPAGNVSGTWNMDGSPYLILGDVMIPTGQSLVISPGVRVEFQGHYHFYVQGSLIAEGAENDSIMITINDSTGWHNLNIPDGGWHGFRFGYSAASSDSSRIRYCLFAFGKAVGSSELDKHGGAIGVLDYPDLVVSNCMFYSNTAQESGGAIAVNNVPITIQRNNFWQNKAYNGGAVSMTSSSPYIEYNFFVDNRASNSGGAIAMYLNCNPEINTNLLAGNFADYGGGVQTMTDCNPILRNNLIYSNVAYEEGGGVDLEDNCQALFINNTIVGNFALFGGGIDVEVNTSPTFINTIIWGNTAFVDGPQIHLFSEDSDPDFYYCDIKGGTDSIGTWYGGTIYLNYTGTYENNIDQDPDFYSQDNYLYLLNDGSSCIDAGDPDAQYNDLENPGNPGFALFPSKGGLRNDMGCYGGPYVLSYEIITGVDDPVVPKWKDEDIILFPNPTSDQLTIRYRMPDPSTTLRTGSGYWLIGIYSIEGRKIRELINEAMPAGTHELEMDVSDLPAGVYFVRVQAEGIVKTQKLVIAD